MTITTERLLEIRRYCLFGDEATAQEIAELCDLELSRREQGCPKCEGLAMALREAQAHIGCAVAQIAPSDDQIIADHMRDANAIMRAAIAATDKGSP